jgi:DNA-binding transcriptional ArsR family regulator
MRKRLLDALLPRTRQAILGATLLQPERWWYLSDLAHHLGVPPSSLQRELASLVAAGILERRRDGGRVYYRPARACPVLPELQALLAKTAGLADVVRDALAPLARRVEWAFVHGSVARGTEASESDVDLVVVGRVGLAELAPRLQRAERRLGRPVNATTCTRSELERALREGRHYLSTVMAGERLVILGDADELARVAGGAAR